MKSNPAQRRGRLLRERGQVARVITYREHFLPFGAALLAGTGARG